MKKSTNCGSVLWQRAIAAGLYSYLSFLTAGESISSGEETSVLKNIAAPGKQYSPCVAAGNDQYIVAWSDGSPALDGNPRIIASRISASGVVLDESGIEVAPNTQADSPQTLPTAAFCQGTYLIVWQDFRNGKDSDVLGVRISPTGKVLDSTALRIASGTGSQCRPSVAASDSGFIVVLQSAQSMGSTVMHKSMAVQVGTSGNVGPPIDILDWPNPKISFNGSRFLVVCGDYPKSGRLHSRMLSTDGKPLSSDYSFEVGGKAPEFSLSSQPGKGWLIVCDRVRPDHWGWGGPGGMRTFFINQNGTLAEDSPKVNEPVKGNELNYLDLQSTYPNLKPAIKTVPYGQSSSVWDGGQSVVVWQRFRLSNSGFAQILDQGDIIAARVTNWKPIDEHRIPISATKFEETSPAIASIGAGKLLLAYTKCIEDKRKTFFRILSTK